MLDHPLGHIDDHHRHDAIGLMIGVTIDGLDRTQFARDQAAGKRIKVSIAKDAEVRVIMQRGRGWRIVGSHRLAGEQRRRHGSALPHPGRAQDGRDVVQVIVVVDAVEAVTQPQGLLVVAPRRALDRLEIIIEVMREVAGGDAILVIAHQRKLGMAAHRVTIELAHDPFEKGIVSGRFRTTKVDLQRWQCTQFGDQFRNAVEHSPIPMVVLGTFAWLGGLTHKVVTPC